MTTPENDPFGRPTSGGRPKLEELEGHLLLIQPTKLDLKVKGKYGEQDRITADVAVLDAEGGVDEIDALFISTKGLVPMLSRCLKPGNRPSVLGTLEKYPTKEYYDAAEKKGEGDPVKGINAMLEEWAKKGAKGEKPQFFWNLADYSDADANVARQYMASRDQFAAASSD